MQNDDKALPFCTAPFTSVLIDPNKGVRPCCSFEGHLGNLQHQTLAEIINGDTWNAVKEEMNKGQIPNGCVDCFKREQTTGWSVRTLYMEAEATKDGTWQNGITELEINSTNVCNLTCVHCSSTYSSKWVGFSKKLNEAGVKHNKRLVSKVFQPDTNRLIHELSQLDLQHLSLVRFKGGEPLLNPDMNATLKYLIEKKVLGQCQVTLVTNGSQLDEELFELLQQAKSVELALSVDGTGAMQKYIRHGNSDNANIEQFVAKFSQLEQVTFTPAISVMAYNVARLDEIADWWASLNQRFGSKVAMPVHFTIQVIKPAFLFVNVLSDGFRQKLIAKYHQLNNADYSNIILSLKEPFAGATVHNEFVRYTQGLDKVRGTTALEVFPELKDELTLLEETHTTTTEETYWEENFSKARSQAAAGNYREALDTLLAANINSSKGGQMFHLAVAAYYAKDYKLCFDTFCQLTEPIPTNILQFIQNTPLSENGGLTDLPFDLTPQERDFIDTPAFKLFVEGLAYSYIDKEHEAIDAFNQALLLDGQNGLIKYASQQYLD